MGLGTDDALDRKRLVNLDGLLRMENASPVEAESFFLLPETGIAENDGHGRQCQQFLLIDKAQRRGVERLSDRYADAERIEHRIPPGKRMPHGDRHLRAQEL